MQCAQERSSRAVGLATPAGFLALIGLLISLAANVDGRPDAAQGRRDRLVADTGFGSGLCTNQPALEVVEASLNSGLETPVSLYSP